MNLDLRRALPQSGVILGQFVGAGSGQPRTRVLRLWKVNREIAGDWLIERAVPVSLPDRSFQRGLGIV